MGHLFCYFDEKGDGKISPAKLNSCMWRSVAEELSAEAAAAVVASSNLNMDGLVVFEDFVRLLTEDKKTVGISIAAKEESYNLLAAFRVYKMEGKGCTLESLKRALHRLGDPRNTRECATVILCFDLTSNDVICFDELRAMMMI